MTRVNLSSKNDSLAKPSHQGPLAWACSSCARECPRFKPRSSPGSSDVLDEFYFRFYLRPKIICLFFAAIIIPFAVNDLFGSQVLLAPTNGLVSIPFAALSFLTSIIAFAIFNADPIIKVNSRLEGLIWAVWPMAPATYFVKMADMGSSGWIVLVTAMMVHACMFFLVTIALTSYYVTSSPVYSQAARKAGREAALEVAREASADGISLHKNAAPDEEKFFD